MRQAKINMPRQDDVGNEISMPKQDALFNEISCDQHAESGGGGAATKTIGHIFNKLSTICFQEQRRCVGERGKGMAKVLWSPHIHL